MYVQQLFFDLIYAENNYRLGIRLRNKSNVLILKTIIVIWFLFPY